MSSSKTECQPPPSLPVYLLLSHTNSCPPSVLHLLPARGSLLTIILAFVNPVYLNRRVVGRRSLGHLVLYLRRALSPYLPPRTSPHRHPFHIDIMSNPSPARRCRTAISEVAFNFLPSTAAPVIAASSTIASSTCCTLAPPPTKRKGGGRGRFTTPVPPPRPDEVLPPSRGRNARKRVIQAEHFRQYIYLRRQLKPWSDSFRAKYGRTPSLVDVHQAGVPGLLDRFVEYLEALDRLRS